ncbi:MAG: response regulator [Candidatus Riflebacteria bacterium]|nr:response regulator [Candidatus Riflebacteria bacterium]
MLNVLMVEDCEDDSILIKRVLEKGGFSPMLFERVDTREEYISALEKHTWDVVIADFSMPNFSGLEAIAILKLKRFDIPFILVSGVIGEETAVEAMRAGAHDYILKNKLTRLIPAIEREIREVKIRREKKHAEEALKEEQKRYRELFENSPVSLWEEDRSLVKDFFNQLNEKGITDFRKYFRDNPSEINEAISRVRVLRTNVTSLRLFEASNFRDLFEKLSGIFESTSNALVTEEMISLAEGCMSFQGEKSITTLQGKKKNIAFQLRVLSGFEKTLGRVLVSFIDLTDRKLMETELLKAKEAAESANRAKDQFLANMTHELRTPLNPVIGFTELLLEMEPTSDQREYLEIIKKRSYDLLAVIDDLLEFSQMESSSSVLKAEIFDLKQLIVDSIQRINPFASAKGLSIEWKMENDVPTKLIGDPVHIKQIINNLLSNAVKFSENGDISIDVTIDSTQKVTRKNFTNLHISVKDKGIGISKEKIDQIFSPFSQVDNSITRKFGGTGLGLAIVRRLVESMNGNITVESEIGVGSTFNIVLGFDLPDSKSFPYLDNKTVQKTSGTDRVLKVLVVEDEPSNRHLAVSLLKKHNHDVHYVEDGKKALECIEAERYDLVLMDIQLPEMDGVAATKRIRELDVINGRHTPIVALTAYASEFDRDRFMKAGMDDFLAKPINRDEFFKVLKNYSSK